MFPRALLVTPPQKRHHDGEQNMATVRDMAKKFESPKTLNIADLKSVSTEMDIQRKTVNKGTPEEFSYDYIVVSGQEYRVPLSVLKSLKTLLKDSPDKVKFKVLREGEGMGTVYTVVLL
jgi:hypothetical protein